jgi:hypothetical protein
METLVLGGGFFLAYFGWIFGVIRIISKEDRMSRLAYLRGDDIEITVAEEHLHEMKTVAKSLGLRRLAPVHVDPSPSWYRDPEPLIVLQCCRCGGADTADKMLANLDGKPYNSYEHERCPEVK